MLDTKLINHKSKNLNKYIKQLRKYKGINKKQLENDLEKLWSVERGLQLSIQIMIDIGNHILSEKGIYANNNKDIFKKLSFEGIISNELYNKISSLEDLRFNLIFNSKSIDINEITDVLNNKLNDFEEFNRYINDYLEKN
jgi:uncharacterized protein YutE (UPF0331/DUF86 family)